MPISSSNASALVLMTADSASLDSANKGGDCSRNRRPFAFKLDWVDFIEGSSNSEETTILSLGTTVS